MALGLYRASVTLQSAVITGGPHTDFPVLITKACLPTIMFDADGAQPATNGGGCVRFSADEAGDARLALEVVTFVTDNNPANGSAELWVKVPSISDAADVVLYVWWGGGGSQPAEGDEFGSEQVWDPTYASVYHMETTTIKDSTSADNDGTDVGTTEGTGKIGKDRTFDGNTDRCDIGLGGFGATSGLLSVWFKPAQNTDLEGVDKRLISRDFLALHNGDINLSYEAGANKLEFAPQTSAVVRYARSPATNFLGGTWYHAVGVWDASEVALYIDGAKQAETDPGLFLSSSATKTFAIGQLAGGASAANESWNGDFDEVRIRSTRPSDDWITTEYDNQDDPATFAIEGAVDVIGDTTVTWAGDDANVVAAKVKADTYSISWDGTINPSVYIEYEIALNKDAGGYVVAAMMPYDITSWAAADLPLGSYVVRVRARHFLEGSAWTEAGSGSTDTFDMTAAFTWPATLPQTVSQLRYTEAFVGVVTRSEMDSGPAKARRRHTAGVERFSSTMQLTTAQVQTLKDFFETSVQGGALEFTWTHPRTAASVKMRFVSSPVLSQLGPAHFEASLNLEIMP